MSTEEGWDRIPEIYRLAEYKSISPIESKEYQLFQVRKLLSVREWLPLMGITLPATLIPGNLIEREILTKLRLIRDYFEYQATIRISTNTIRCVKYHSNKITDIIPFLPPGSIILADAEFDVGENYRNAKAACMDLHVKQRKGDAHKSIRKIARLHFDKKKYRKRKLGERPFGNIEVRRSRCYYKKQENKLKGAILIACDHNITAYFNNKAWCGLFAKVKWNDRMRMGGIN